MLKGRVKGVYLREHASHGRFGPPDWSSFLNVFEFLWRFRVAQLVRMEIERVNANAVFYFAFAKLVQIRTLLRILLEIVGDTL